MKKNILSLFVVAGLWHASTAAAAIVPQITFTQTTNAVLTWPSTPGDSFMVLHRASFHPSRPWKLLATNLPAGPYNTTTFTHVGAFFTLPGGIIITGGSGSGGGGSPPGSPAAATLAAPSTTSPTTPDTGDKVKKNDSPAGPPALPDEKELEKLYREWLKEWEKQQSPNGNTTATVQTFSAATTYTLPDSAYTNFPGGFYVITRTTDDTDADGLPDWWEAVHGLNLLVNDAAEDPDSDGFNNLAEYNYGTDPRDPNSKPSVQLTFTTPVNTSTWLPVVQITGSLNLNVRTLLFDVTNAAGTQTGLEGFITRRIVMPGDGFTNSPSRYTNSFQCFDVPLTNGANTVTLRFTDAYGYSFATNLVFTVDLNASPAAPVGTVFWPTNGTQLGADTFTVRGRLDNPTATVVARMTFNGEMQEFGGLVERDGTFWLEGLPAPASGPLTLVFTDAGGKSSTNTLAISRSPVSVTLNDPTGNDVWSKTLNLSGTVNNTNYSVWVNGVRASVSSGIWSASNVPVNAGGVASFSLRVVANSDNGGAGTGAQSMSGSSLSGFYLPPTGNPNAPSAVDVTFDFDRPPRIVVAGYTRRYQDDNPTYDTGSTNRQTLDWTRSGDGYSGSGTRYYEMKSPPYPGNVWRQTDTLTYPFPGTNGTDVATGFYTSGAPFAQTSLLGPLSVPWETGAVFQQTATRNYAYKGETFLELQTGGRAYPNAASLFEFNGSATVYNAEGWPANLPPNTLRIMEQALDAAGYTYRTNLPANTTLALTFAAVNAAMQAPATVQPSTGIKVGFSTGTGSLRLRPTGPHYYVTPTNRPSGLGWQTNSGPLYLGYSQYRLPYNLNETILGNLVESIEDTRPLVIGFQTNGLVAVGQKLFWWDGIVPQKQVGNAWVNQRINTRQFINPNLANLRGFVTATEMRYGTNSTRMVQGSPPMRLRAKAVVASNLSSISGHLTTVAGSLQGIGYTPETDSSLSLASVTNGAALGLVWYSITDALTNSNGGLIGLSVSGGTLTPATLPSGLHYSLVFFNGCRSLENSGGTVTAFANAFGGNCAVVGWNDPVSPDTAKTVAGIFFNALQSGNTVEQAAQAVRNDPIGQTKCFGLLPALVKDSFQAFSNGQVVVDLTR